MNDHTPGPWKPFSGAWHKIEGSNGHLVAHIATPSPDENANARLIAAAPDMLATLKAIQNAVFDYKQVDSDFGLDIGTMASQAIAKATDSA